MAAENSIKNIYHVKSFEPNWFLFAKCVVHKKWNHYWYS